MGVALKVLMRDNTGSERKQEVRLTSPRASWEVSPIRGIQTKQKPQSGNRIPGVAISQPPSQATDSKCCFS